MHPVLEEDLNQINHAFTRRERLSGATILVTGGAGFLGFELLHYFDRYADALKIDKVIALDNYRLVQPAWMSGLSSRIEAHTFDISSDRIEDIPGADRATHVIHMASVASPTYYRRYPIETIDANVWGLRRLLDYYREHPLEGLLFFSSSEVYGDPVPEAIPTDETYCGNVTSIGPRACYDESKRFGETLCYYYHEQYGVPAVIVRPFNNFGPGMRLDDKRVPADFARAVLDDRPIVIHSDGSPTRTFCYISDAIAGYLNALTYGRFDVFNIGMDRPEISVRELADIYALSGKFMYGYAHAPVIVPPKEAAYLTDCPQRRCPNIDKARRDLGYAPRVSVTDGISRFLTFLGDQGKGGLS